MAAVRCRAALGDPMSMHTERTDGPKFDRPDRVGLLALLWIVALGAFVQWVVVPAVNWAKAGPIHGTVQADVEVRGLTTGAIVDSPTGIGVSFADPTAAQRALAAMPGLLTFAVVLFVVWLLTGLLRDLGSGEPFTTRSVLRLNLIALTVGLGAAVVTVANVVAELGLNDAVLSDEVSTRAFLVDMPFGFLGAMLVIAAIAEAFRHGVRLRDDVDGLV